PSDETGGGIRNFGGSLAINDCIIFKCTSSEDAGGIDTRENGETALADSIVRKNTSKRDGGGAGADEGVLTLDRVTFDHNKAKTSGGAFENFGNAMVATNVTFVGNK